jgi:NAD(P)H-quinone oxidoreductase subunit K
MTPIATNNPSSGLEKLPLINPVCSPKVTQPLSESVILTTVDDLYNWAKMFSLYPLMAGTPCCFIEFSAMLGVRFDLEQFRMFPRMAPRQADLLIAAGTITIKYASALVRLYEQMPEPKYVMAMGDCTITGGMFSADSPSAVRGVDKLIPVDIHLPGCPPPPAAILDEIVKLRKKIANETLQKRSQTEPTHYYKHLHPMMAAPAVHNGRYLEPMEQPIAEHPLTVAERLPLSLKMQHNCHEIAPA